MSEAGAAEAARRVLYVDDDAALARLVQKDLRRHGYDVTIALDGPRALEQARHGRFDVIALDHYLPGTTGIDLMPLLRDRDDPVPVVYVAGTDEGRVAIAALKAGASDYVIKDVSGEFFTLLRAAIEQALLQDRMRRDKELAERETREARDRAEMLLREVNHRVGNSLQLVSSFVRLQASHTADPGARDVLWETEARIAAVAQVHKRLYTSDDIRYVRMEEYLEGLLDELAGTLRTRDRPHRLLIDAERIELATDRAVSVGIIVTELVTNAFKYAYPDGVAGDVRVELRRGTDGRLVLTVADDGVGSTADAAVRGTGLGRKVIAAMAQSLRSDIVYDTAHRGTRVLLTFATH
ncbi:sensor histidine kinase [Chelatococcus reniformis]|uniref:histidine kinase n=1 Tax=Chelatococcus reniformis TaxID=1494448 RepID=A0A916TYP1_9HYPH|nr:histidine kinase dimerization/phosphoacceptor domain -containing protein [Chelatococcus reniformis]GGC51829.1 two-component system sensor histidine kinase/response regulator [Chelatococcus reniformis]